MKTRAIFILVFGLLLVLDVIAQETLCPDGPAIGASMGERGGAMSAGFDLTTPYLDLYGKLDGALRFGGDMQLMEGIIVGGSADSSMESYFSLRAGLVIAASIIPEIRVYDESGGIVVFPSDRMATSAEPGLGFYSHIGVELYISNHGGVFLEIGDEMNAGGTADRFEGSPYINNGLTACGGVRLYF